MPIRTVLDDPTGIVMFVVTGTPVGEEIIQAQKRLYLNSDHDPTTPLLFDARNADSAALNFSEIERIVDRSTYYWNKMSGGRSAILVGTDDDQALGRMYKTLAAAMPRGIQVFGDYEEAVNWLQESRQPESRPASSVKA